VAELLECGVQHRFASAVQYVPCSRKRCLRFASPPQSKTWRSTAAQRDGASSPPLKRSFDEPRCSIATFTRCPVTNSNERCLAVE
jgi:hypothetical protein